MNTPTYKMKGTEFYGKGLPKKMKNDPCWDNYEMKGTKMKGGEEVPNCVPTKKKASPCPGCKTLCQGCAGMNSGTRKGCYKK